MKYIVELKSDLDLLNEDEAKQRYLELMAAGYKENNIFVAAPVNVTSDITFGAHSPASGGESASPQNSTPGFLSGSNTNSLEQNPSSVEEEMFINPT